jgi:hypothetical protein
MNFTEFKRRLGAEPLGGDAEILRARESSPEFEQAAVEAERFEKKLGRAVSVSVPDNLLNELQAISQQSARSSERSGWWRMALAASVLIAVGAAGLTWKLNPSWDSVEDYLVDHYRHDGAKVLAMTSEATTHDVQSILAGFDVKAAPALAEIVGVIKSCPTPDGKGVHMVLNTQDGPVTVIYMPDTVVSDGKIHAFDNVQAILVELQHGSAAIIGADSQRLSDYYAIVRNSIVPAG